MNVLLMSPARPADRRHASFRQGCSWPRVIRPIVRLLAAGPLQLDFTLDQPGSPVSPAQRAQIFSDVYGNDPAIFLAQSPWMLAELNRPALLAAGTPIRQLIGGADFTLPANLDFHARMTALAIPHGFFNPPGIGHDVLALFGA
jgi:hypothetical protein